MPFTLGPQARAGAFRLAEYDTIGSTNAEALARARAGDPGRLWVAALAQTAGHGRRGRPWQTPTGNLAASLLIRPAAPPAVLASLGFAAGLALDHAIRTCTSAETASQLRLKWPNDVLLGGAKVAGILLETAAGEGEGTAVVIGFGVNVRNAPVGLPYPVAALAASGASADAGDLFTALAEAWVEQERLWAEGRGFAAIRTRWLDRAAGLGGSIAIQAGADVLRGTFETIDDDGRLVMRRADGGLRHIAAGDVHFGAAATLGA